MSPSSPTNLHPAPLHPESHAAVRSRWFIGLVLVGVAVRLILSQLGHNWDMECWIIDADLARSGATVYAETDRYNYGPLWFNILRALRSIELDVVQPLVKIPGHEKYHLFVALFLSTIDALTSFELAKRFGRAVAIAFILSPIGMLVSGFQSQCDNTAIYFALVASRFIFDDVDASRRTRSTMIAGLLLAISLAVKHVMLFFPLWLLLIPTSRLPRRRAMAIVALAYGLCALMFVPYALTPENRHGIYVHVIAYRSFMGSGDSIFARMLKPFGITEWHTLTRIFIGALLIVGAYFARRRPPRDLVWLYTVVLLLLTPAFADQYLAIPLIAISLHWRKWYAWVYTVLGAAVLLTSPYYSALLHRAVVEGAAHVSYRVVPAYAATIWLIPLLFARASRDQSRNSTTNAAALTISRDT